MKNSISNVPSPHFNLCENDRCPHLNEKGLCNIILNLGEDCLCDICREHPRFYNYTNYGKEVGIGISCEEAARIVLTSDCYSQIIEIGKADGQPEKTDFDAVLMRKEIFDVLSDSTLPYSEKLALIHKKYNVNTTINTDKKWQNILSNLEYLDENHRSLLSSCSSDMHTPPEIEKYAERILAYFIFRHTPEAYNKEDFCISLGFCLLCERLFVSVCRAENATALDQIIDIARTISEEIEYSEENTEIIKNEFV